MKGFTFVIALIALVFTLYNTWQIGQIKAAQKTAVAQMSTIKKSPSTGAMKWIDKADQHASKASDFLLKGEYSKAKRELDFSLEDMKYAQKESGQSVKSQIDILTEKVNAIKKIIIPNNK